MAENATAEDWVTLLEVAYGPTPIVVPLIVEVFKLNVLQGKTFKQAFDRCAELFVKGL